MNVSGGARDGLYGFDVCIARSPIGAIRNALTFRDKRCGENTRDQDHGHDDAAFVADVRAILNQVNAEAAARAAAADPEFARQLMESDPGYVAAPGVSAEAS